jgi:hypothetical protein
MSRRAHILGLGAAVLVTAVAGAASAYDAHYTHRWLTRMAVRHLVARYPGVYDELLTYIDTVADGAQHEDDPLLDGDTDPTTLRVMRHFFRPTDESGLSYGGHDYPSSYEWAALPRDDNEWGYDDGLAAYRAGDTEEAYFVLGHIAHLIEDATVPAHTHLDAHGPPFGDSYESYCTSQMMDELTSLLPLPPEDAPVPAFADLHEAWMATARASYWRNMYPGEIDGTESVSGVLADMFPSIRFQYLYQNWRIGDPPVGQLGKGFKEDQPGWFYFKVADYPAAVDKVAYDPYADPGMGDTFGPNDDEVPMAALMARDLVPVAILHAAGVMKLFLDEAYATAPAPEKPMPMPPDAGCATAPTPVNFTFFSLAPVLAALLFVARRRVR